MTLMLIDVKEFNVFCLRNKHVDSFSYHFQKAFTGKFFDSCGNEERLEWG